MVPCTRMLWPGAGGALGGHCTMGSTSQTFSNLFNLDLCTLRYKLNHFEHVGGSPCMIRCNASWLIATQDPLMNRLIEIHDQKQKLPATLLAGGRKTLSGRLSKLGFCIFFQQNIRSHPHMLDIQ